MVWAFPWISIPLPPRSGKFGTPLARMHFENASELVELEPLLIEALAPELLGLAEEPQAATAMAQATAIKGSMRKGRTRMLLVCVPDDELHERNAAVRERANAGLNRLATRVPSALVPANRG